MEKQVIYRSGQHLEHSDLINAQAWTDEALAHVVSDAVTPEKQYTGLTVTARSSTEVEIAPGRLYDGTSGRVYAIETAQVQSVFAMLPLQDQKWLAVSVMGTEEELNLEPRDFLIDLEKRLVEPQIVSVQRRRVAVPHIAQGLESPTPERPQAPTGYVLIAHVRLSPAGIQEVVLADTFRLPNLHRVDQRLKTAEGWITSAEPRLATIMSDIAGLGSEVAARATIEQAVQLAIDLARVKERMELPDDYVFYGGDHYLDLSESDIAHPDFLAFVDEGVRMPVVASQTDPLVLLNPLDPAAKTHGDGFVLPAYTEVSRLRMENRAGELTINQYQYNTIQVRELTMARTRIRYGGTRTVCTNSLFWRSGRYDPVSGIFERDGETFEVANTDGRIEAGGLTHYVRITQFWEDSYQDTYWGAVVEAYTVQGSLLAQTLLNAQTGWCTSVDLYFTGVAADGAVNLLLTEARLGQPDMSKVLARATIAASSLVPGWNRIPWTRPVFLEAGKRYAMPLVSGGAHRVGTTQGMEYTQGMLQYSQDAAYFQAADDRDLMMRLNFARFSTPRVAIQLQPLQLAGGIHDLDLMFEGYTPDGCQLFFEYQVGGQWVPMNGSVPSALTSGPALLPLRAVFLGTTDLMPGILLPGSTATTRRFGAAFRHVSTLRTLAAASDQVIVRCLVESFDAGLHTFGCELLVDDTPVAPTSVHSDVVDAGAGAMWVESRFSLGAPVTEYAIALEGATTNAAVGWHVAERYDIAL